jgi:hypothetical protein
MEAKILKGIVDQREGAELENEHIDEQVQTKKRQQLQLQSEAHAQNQQKKRKFDLIEQPRVRPQPTIQLMDGSEEEDLFKDIDP